jgi:hypothetical protein
MVDVGLFVVCDVLELGTYYYWLVMLGCKRRFQID